MAKYLSVPDFHFDMEHLETSKQCGKRIAEIIKEEKIDFILIPGDWFNRPIIASEKGGIIEAKKIMKSWLDLCPCFAIEGTPSHDAPGCYSIFEEMGLKLLKPYSYEKIKDVLIFGIPELNKQNIQAKLQMSAYEANAEVINYFKEYITEWLAPTAMKFIDAKKVCMFHGNVSDSRRENETDRILKASDIVIYTDDLMSSGIDRWELGHIHTPWESKKINAGYGGSYSLNWGEVNFIPSLIINDFKQIKKVPYGTPKRIKVNSLLDNYNSNTAYWFDVEDTNISLPENLHPWSRITYTKQNDETRRIGKDKATNIKSLWDLFLLIDEKVNLNLKEKVELIESSIKQNKILNKDIRLKRINIRNCILFKNKTIDFGLEKYPNTIIELSGENGSGKSSLLSFCSPYPCIIGKDTDSGRQSAIKDFFTDGTGEIIKEIIVNGEIHSHIITLKNGKCECYLSIEGGMSILEKSTFENMMSKCEELYGNFNDYFNTSFYVQPFQGSFPSGLMSASLTEIRNVVQNIAGIDREQEKRFALDMLNEAEKESKILEVKISTTKEFQQNKDDLLNNKKILERDLSYEEIEIKQITENGIKLKSEFIELEKQKQENDKLKTILQQKEIELQNNKNELKDIEIKLNDPRLFNYEKNKIDFENLKTVKVELQKVMEEKFNAIKNNNEIDLLDNQIKFNEKQQADIFKPCEFCGKLPSNLQERMHELKKENAELYSEFSERIKRDIGIIDTKILLLESQLKDYNNLQENISIAEKINVQELTANKNILLKGIETLTEEITKIKIKLKDFYIENYEVVKNAIEELRNKYNEINLKINSTKLEIKSIEEKLKNIEEINKRINDMDIELNKKLNDKSDWNYISKMLSADKIPALELELVLDFIDSEATKNIIPFLDGKYSFKTITQDVGKKAIIDRFDIVVHDNETGEDKSFVKFNPGHKSFFNDAYIKALVKQRNNKLNVNYSPVIYDESDGNISPARIPMYYEIQKNYYSDNKTQVLIVSHAIDAHNYIQNQIIMEDLKV